jgi:hypothetical protein
LSPTTTACEDRDRDNVAQIRKLQLRERVFKVMSKQIRIHVVKLRIQFRVG